MKQAHLAKAKDDINPNFIEVSERAPRKQKPKEVITDVEWWYVILLTLLFFVIAVLFVSNIHLMTLHGITLRKTNSYHSYQTERVTTWVLD